MNKILCVEDSSDIELILSETLKSYDVVFSDSIEKARILISKQQFQMIILDISLPDGSGLELLATMAEELKDVPIIVLTGKKDFATKVSAFTLGADDFILKPFDPNELKLRVNSKLKKANANLAQNSQFVIGSIICNLNEQRLRLDNSSESIELTSIEFKIFILLAKTPNKIFSREEILDRAWGNGVVISDRSVDVHISNLRKKICSTNVTVEAVIGSGYRAIVKGN